jgi:hypothetical protein
MPKKDKWRQRAPQWEPLRQCAMSPEEVALVGRQCGLADEDLAVFLRGTFWRNDRYQVHQLTLPDGWVWLSIHRRNREPCRDWRDLQRIKNQLLGAECEAVELYPAESRLVDTSNEYHLMGSTDPAWRFPFGFQERLVLENPPGKAKQRPLAYP